MWILGQLIAIGGVLCIIAIVCGTLFAIWLLIGVFWSQLLWITVGVLIAVVSRLVYDHTHKKDNRASS
jgi:hypothetical protein